MVTEITRDHLLRWATTREAQGDLPRLVRSLVLETAEGVTDIHFPGGGGVASGGFDGVVAATSATAFVPQGTSVWELSVEDGANRKADDDYAKRTAGPGDTPMGDCTYVQFIARPWTDHERWATERAYEGRWGGVRAYNVDRLEAWLQQAPATSAWLARRLGLPTIGVIATSDWFETWAGATDPATTTEMVLAGREQAAEQLRALLTGRPRIITVGGKAHPDELRAFVAAAIAAPADSIADVHGLFVDDRGSFERLLAHQTPAILIVPDATWLPARLGEHRIVVPVRAATDCDVTVPPVSGHEIAEALKLEGVDRREADELGELARRSLLAFRRRIAVHRAVHRPSWAEPPIDRIRRRLLLVDRWHDLSEGDHEAVANLAEEDDASIEDQLSAIAGVGDPMVTVVDGLWHVVSPKDTWHLLADRLTRTDLERFRAVALEVLGERDPSLDLPAEERWLASMRGLRRRHSETLREGLVHTLAKLGAYDATVDTGRGMTGQRWADHIVRELLDKANDDRSLSTWASLASQLPLLAEAAPTVFLRAVTDGLSGDEPLLAGLFQDDPEASALTSSSPHTHLLWALERIAWAPEHFDDAVARLAMLAELDPGGRLTNRPQESLASIFCPWLPHTDASPEQRLMSLERLRGPFPEVTWKLLLSQLPESHALQVEQAGAEYRIWGRDRAAVTRAEYLRLVESVADMLIGWLPQRADRAADLVERADDLPPTQRRSLAAILIDIAAPDGPFAEPQRAVVWEVLRSLIAKHREYADAHWALPAAELEPLAQALAALEPPDPGSRHAWLFDDGLVTLGDLRRRDDHDAYEVELRARRRSAVDEVLAHGGLETVSAFTRSVKVPHYVGFALGEVGDAALDEPMLQLLDDDESGRIAAHGYIVARFQAGGWEWLDTLLAAVEVPSPAITARALLASRDPVGGPSRADAADDAVRDAFWREFSYYGLGQLSATIVEQLARSLLDAGRPAAALDLLALYERRRADSSTERALLVAEALEGLLASSDDPEIRRLSGYEFERLFALLADHREVVGTARVVRIEWAFAPALGYEPDLRNTYATLAEEPALFVELVSLQYRGEEDDEPASDDQRRAADNAFRVLAGWKACPASAGDGTVDSHALRAWVEQARASFDEKGLGDVGDTKIGEAFAHAAEDADGNWPPVPVRDLMQDLANERVERGFEIQTYNNRGTVWRDPEGGDQERELAGTYQAYAERARLAAPRVAAVLDRLAETYETEARQHDDEAERRRRGLGF